MIWSGPAGRQLKALPLAFWSPSSAIDCAIVHSTPCLMQAVLILFQIAVTTFAYRLTVEYSLRLVPSEIPEQLARNLNSSFQTLGYLALISGVIACFLWWYAAAGCLHFLDILINRKEQPFGKMLSLAVLASVYLSLKEAYLLLLCYLRGYESFKAEEGFRVPIGLNLLPFHPSPYWWTFLGHINIFEISSVVLTAFAFVRLTKAPRRISYPCIVTLWLFWTAIRSLGALAQ